MNRIEELQGKANKSLYDARDLLNRAENEKRTLTTEEEIRYDLFIKDLTDAKKEIVREESLRALEADFSSAASSPVVPVIGENRSGDVEKRDAFTKYLRGGMSVLDATEHRALTVGNPTSGGYLLPPQEFVSELIKGVDENVFIRRLATKHTLTTSESLGMPSVDTDIGDAEWTSEVGAATEDTAFKVGRRVFKPNPLVKLVKVSETLVQKSPDIERIIRERMIYKFGIAENNAFMNGNGVDKALGVFFASNDGVTTSQDVSTDNTATAITMDGLKNAKYKLKAPYHKRATTRWAFHSDAVKMLSKLKETGTGAYIWSESARVGDPDMLLGVPLEIDDYVPNTFTASNYVGVIGDWSYYHIVDALNVTIQRLNELYTVNNLIGYKGRMECDGMPVLSEAFVRVKLGS